MRSFAIIPAAGRSRRMGAPKLLLPWGDRTLFEHVLAQWCASDVDRVFVVIHPDDARLAELARSQGVEVVIPAEAPPEMKDSVAAALRHIEVSLTPNENDVWLLAPADVPDINQAVVAALLDAARTAPEPIIVPLFAGRRGHPVLFRWSLAVAARALGPDQGLNQFLRQFPVREVAVSDHDVAEDVDTPEDYERLKP